MLRCQRNRVAEAILIGPTKFDTGNAVNVALPADYPLVDQRVNSPPVMRIENVCATVSLITERILRSEQLRPHPGRFIFNISRFHGYRSRYRGQGDPVIRRGRSSASACVAPRTGAPSSRAILAADLNLRLSCTTSSSGTRITEPPTPEPYADKRCANAAARSSGPNARYAFVYFVVSFRCVASSNNRNRAGSVLSARSASFTCNATGTFAIAS